MKDSRQWMVEPFLFSGRPNPQWLLTAGQVQEWKKMWEAAPHSNMIAKLPTVLGYTGCKIQIDTHSYWLITGGCVSLFEGEHIITSKTDKGKLMEQFLLHTAPEEVKQTLRMLRLI